jgi:hypothetical protein
MSHHWLPLGCLYVMRKPVWPDSTLHTDPSGVSIFSTSPLQSPDRCRPCSLTDFTATCVFLMYIFIMRVYSYNAGLLFSAWWRSQTIFRPQLKLCENVGSFLRLLFKARSVVKYFYACNFVYFSHRQLWPDFLLCFTQSCIASLEWQVIILSCIKDIYCASDQLVLKTNRRSAVKRVSFTYSILSYTSAWRLLLLVLSRQPGMLFSIGVCM